MTGKLTEKRARKLVLRKLRYYTKLEEQHRVSHFLPESIRLDLENFYNRCPLCQLFVVKDPKDGEQCTGCPLTVPTCNKTTDEYLYENIGRVYAWKPIDLVKDSNKFGEELKKITGKSPHWIECVASYLNDSQTYTYFKCSECGFEILRDYTFCPSCGQRMRV